MPIVNMLQLRVRKSIKVLFYLILFSILSWNGYAQTMLIPGDILVVSINSSNSTIEILPLIDLEVDTKLKIKSENEVNTALEFVVTKELKAGNSIVISEESSDYISVEGTLHLNDEANVLTIVQENELNQILFAVYWGKLESNNSDWHTINIPFIHLQEGLNHQYHLKNGASGTPHMIRSMIINPDHWKISDKAFPKIGTSFRILEAPVVVFNQNISSIIEGDSIPLQVAIFEHDGSKLTVDITFNQSFSTADTNDMSNFDSYTVNFTGLIGNAVYEIDIPQMDDVFYEGRETVLFELQNLSAGSLGDFVTHAAFIVDNEIPDLSISSLFKDKEQKTIEFDLKNNENAYVIIKNYNIQFDQKKYQIDNEIELSPYEYRTITATELLGTSKKDIPYKTDHFVLYDNNGTTIIEFDQTEFNVSEYQVTQNENNEVILQFERPNHITQHTTSADDVSIQLETGNNQKIKGWYPKNSTQDLENLPSMSVFWDEQLSRFRDAAVVMPDSVLGKAFFYYLDTNVTLHHESPIILDSLIHEVMSGMGVESTVNDEWSIVLSASDVDGNGVINGVEGYNFIQYNGLDSISVSTLKTLIEEQVGDNYIQQIFYKFEGSIGLKPILTNHYLQNGDFFWIKADSVFNSIELKFPQNIVSTNQEVSQIEKEPVSWFALTINTNKGANSITVNFHDKEEIVPQSLLNPTLDLGYDLVESNDPHAGIFYNSNWYSELHIPLQQELLFTFPIGIMNRESSEVSLMLEDWNMEGGWRLFLEDMETEEKIEIHPGEINSFEYSIDIPDQEVNSDTDIDLKKYSTNKRFQLLVASPNYKEVILDSPELIELNQNYPNPFNPATTISFFIPEAVKIKLSVFNVVGQPIAVLEEGTLNAGEYQYEWNATGYPSGMYIYQLEVGNKVMTRKMTLVK